MSGFDFDAVIDRRGTGSSKWSRYPADVLPMWVADMDFAVAPAITAAIRRRLDHPVLGYAVPREALREAVTAMLARDYGWQVSPEAVCLLPGVEAGFNMALKALLRPGEGVVVQTPAYRPILAAPGHWGLSRIDVKLAVRGDAVDCDLAALGAAMRGAGALLFCNPHNPLGKVFTRPELESIAAAALTAGCWIISDEIHCDLVYDGRRHIPTASLDPAVAARCITLMSGSKTYNIAGLKTGFAIIPDATLRQRFLASRLGMVDSVNALGLEATLAALTEAGPWKQALLPYLQANRDWLVEAVRSRLPGVSINRPEGTFLAWLDGSSLGLGGAEPQPWFLEHARVGLSAGSEFGEPARLCARLNFGCPRSVLEAGVARLQASLERG
jgi:cystathionine beta-lyase